MDQIVTYPATEETYVGKGGLKIFFRAWRPEGTPKAVIVICHGVNSHGGQYIWPAEQFVKSGFAVYALDLRGRGRSEGERFYVETIDDYVADVGGVIEIAKERDPSLPVFLLGHSAGGVVSSTRSTTRRSWPDLSARASPSRCRRPTLRSPRSRASATSRHASPCSPSTTRTFPAIQRPWRRSTTTR